MVVGKKAFIYGVGFRFILIK